LTEAKKPHKMAMLEVSAVARALFTQEQVFEVADAMASEGKEVTALALLSKLGGASLTTIYKHLFAWKEARKQEPPAATTTIPDSVQSVFSTALGRVWSVAAAEAAKEVASAKEKAAQDVQAANQQFEEAMQAIERLEQQADTDAGKIETLGSRVTELEAALQKVENEKSGLKATAEQLRDQVGSHQAELARFHKTAESERERHRKEVQQISSDAEKAQEALNKQLATIKASLSESQNNLGLAQMERNEAKVKAEVLMSEKAKAEQLADTARKEKEQALQEAAQARGQIQALTSQNSELMTKLSAKK
jgi:uncharacterized protein (DUF3084 family)